MITPGNILVHELIGLEAEVVRCADREMEGMKGKVVDETKNTLVIESGGRERIIPKAHCVFRFALPDGRTAEVSGKLIALDPVERSKKLAQNCRVI
ncbi:Ribonuclease P protein component 1 [uncultured archaeon]|nr:Ribonuclease P protein component 1 [uncultured archaeon]